MIGVGKLAAKEILGAPSKLMDPFRLSRDAEGRWHPVSNSPFPLELTRHKCLIRPQCEEVATC